VAVTAERLQVIVEAQTDKAIKDLDKVSKQTNKTAGSFDKFGKLLKAGAVAGGLAAVGIAVTKLVQVGGDLISSFAEQEQAEARLAQTLESTGFAAGLTASELTKLASELQNVTKFGDEAIISSQAVLATFKNIGEDVFPGALESILNVSEALGQDLQSSTIQIGKALNDPVEGLTALRRVGITFTAAQEDLIKSFADANDLASAQGIILEELESQFGGVARAAAETATGGFTQLANVAGDTKELLGGLLSEALRPLADGFKDALLGVNQFIVSQQALKAVEEGLADIEQLRIVRQERINDLQRLATDLARTELRIQEIRSGKSQENYRNELAVLEDLVGGIRENKDAAFELVAATDAQIAAEQEAIDSAQQLAAERVAADAAAAASALETSETRQEASDESTENERENIFAELELRKAAIAEENAVFLAQFNARQALREAELAEERAAYEVRRDLAEDFLSVVSQSAELVGEAFATGEDAAKAFGKVAVTAIADVISGFAEQAFVQAAIAFASGNFVSGATLTAAGIGAQIAAGAVKASAANFQTGTGPQGFTVPQGFEGDTFPVAASSGETVRVDRPGESGGGGMTQVVLELDGRVIGSVFADLSDAGRLRINPRAVRGL
jgi:murein DD-endopeptidase MepM/ murein hydrolase activator NlpD